MRNRPAASIAVASILLIMSAALAYCQPQDPVKREQIGEVLGKPVYRDQIRSQQKDPLRNELHRVFSGPVLKKYREAHQAEITPTAQELEAATAYFVRASREELKEEEPALRRQLQELERQLGDEGLSSEARRKLRFKQSAIEARFEPPDRELADFVLTQWKFQKHLYDQYGGGRILWQQAGMEAFDAYHKWLQEHERQGDFRITDPDLRSAFYEYWTTMKHGPFLTSNPAEIRSEFIEPEWAPKASPGNTPK